MSFGIESLKLGWLSRNINEAYLAWMPCSISYIGLRFLSFILSNTLITPEDRHQLL